MLIILVGLRRTGYGRLLYAIGDNPVAARLSGARAWQVLIVLYVISALLAGVGGLLLSGLTNTASVSLADSLVLPSVAAAVIGGTSILGGRGGYGGTLVGALILTVLTALLTALGLPGADASDRLRRDHRDRRGRLHPGHRRDLIDRERRPSPPDVISVSTSAARTSSGWSSSTTATWRDARPRPGRDAGGRRVRTRSCAARRAVGAEAVARLPRCRRRIGIGVPGLYDPATGATRFLVNVPGRLGRSAGRRARSRRRSAVPVVAHQRRPRVRPGRAAAGCRARCALDGRADPRAPGSAA